MGVPSVVGRLFLKNDSVPGVTWWEVGWVRFPNFRHPSLPLSLSSYLSFLFFFLSFLPSFAICAAACARKIVVFSLTLTAFCFKLFV